MGQSKGGGYIKQDTLNPAQQQLLNQTASQASPYTQQAAEGFAQFLPGGGGGQAIQQAAMNRYQQQTLPQIMNLFGSDSKSSSSLNQALASSAADLNTNLASQLAQMQLQAAGGLGNLGTSNAQMALNTPAFAYMQRQQPLWQQLLLSGVGVGGQLGAAALGAPRTNINFGGQ